MTSIKVKFRASSVQGHPGRLYYQVIHDRVVRQIPTRYKVFPSEWDRQGGSIVVDPLVLDSSRLCALRTIQEQVYRDIARLNKIVSVLSRQKYGFMVEEIVSRFVCLSHDLSFFHFMRGLVAQLSQLGRERTAETYMSAMSSFSHFREGNDVLVDEIDADLMRRYEAFLRNRGLTMNTISFYMRILRAAYNRAVEKGLTPQRFPFKAVYTGVDRTVKRAVPLRVMKQIRALDLATCPSLDFTRDMFLFSFLEFNL